MTFDLRSLRVGCTWLRKLMLTSIADSCSVVCLRGEWFICPFVFSLRGVCNFCCWQLRNSVLLCEYYDSPKDGRSRPEIKKTCWVTLQTDRRSTWSMHLAKSALHFEKKTAQNGRPSKLYKLFKVRFLSNYLFHIKKCELLSSYCLTVVWNKREFRLNGVRWSEITYSKTRKKILKQRVYAKNAHGKNKISQSMP